MSKSNCCGSTIKVSNGDEGTNCYMCEECGKACDAMPDHIMSKKEILGFFEKELTKVERLSLFECIVFFKSVKHHWGEDERVYIHSIDISNSQEKGKRR